jgi:hypothetical protein
MSKSNGKTKQLIKRSSAVVRTKRRKGQGLAVGAIAAQSREILRTITAVTIIRPLSAANLKDILWETLTDLKAENIMPNRAKRGVPMEIIDFSEGRATLPRAGNDRA